MPYSNLPKDKWEAMDKCVDKVMAKGKPKENAIAICHASIMKGKEHIGLWETLSAFFGVKADKEAGVKAACHYKEATDAPNLRGHEQNRCANCNYYTLLPMEGTDTPNGLCFEHDFVSQDNWICDDWEAIPPPEAVLVELQVKESSVTVHKQADGKWRWMIVSSSSFMDKDKEIVSQKALEDDTAHMNETGEFGLLDWWHTPIKLGQCDFSQMHGLLRVESGIFDDDEIAVKLAEHADELAASLSFRHSIVEPDAGGVYSQINTFARALLPRGKEANLLTRVAIASEESQMLEAKIKELVAKLGGDKAAEEKVKALLANAEKSEQAAIDAGITHKEETPPPETVPEKPAWFLADMKPDEFVKLVAQGVQEALQPTLQESKESKETQVTAIKEAVGGLSKALLDELKAISQKQTDLRTRLSALEGLTPRGYRATQDSNTETTQDSNTETTKEAQPAGDEKAPYFEKFVANMFGGAQTNQPEL